MADNDSRAGADGTASGETLQRLGLVSGLSVGMGTGLPLGMALHNMAVGIIFGLSIGAIVMIAFLVAASKLRGNARQAAAVSARDGVTRDDGDVLPDPADPDQRSADSADS